MGLDSVRIVLLVLYAIGVIVLIARSIRQVFFLRWRVGNWDALMVDVSSTDLTSDPFLTRLRRRLSAILLFTAKALLWPKHFVESLIVRPFLRRDELGRLRPRGAVRPLLYLQFFLSATLFAALPVAILAMQRPGPGPTGLHNLLAGVLLAHLLARHTAMLVFPDDMKAMFRRTAGNPRFLFIVLFCIDTFTFAVLVQHWQVATPGGDDAETLSRVIVELISIAEIRAIFDQLKLAYEAGLSGLWTGVGSLLSEITGPRALEIGCSGFIYLNLVRMLLPLSSWEQTGEDRKMLARGFLLWGMADEARAYMEEIKGKDYDVDAARLDALLAAERGDYQAAKSKIVWAHGREGLTPDPDLVFLDAVVPAMGLPGRQVDIHGFVGFALETEVSDVVLAVVILWLFLVERLRSEAAVELAGRDEMWKDRPLCRAALKLGTGDREGAQEVLGAYRQVGLASDCAAALFREIAASPGGDEPAPSVHDTARTMAHAVTVEAIDKLPLAQAQTLVSILTMLRLAVAISGGDSAPLLHSTSRLIARLRDHYPGHREDLAMLENYGRMAEQQLRRDLARSAKGRLSTR